MYRFALRPRWIVTHAFIVVIAGLCALAGFWQLNRLADRRTHIASVLEKRSLPVASIADVLDDPDASVHRRVRAVGRYDTGREVVLIGRPNEGRPGNHVLTPLVIPGGRAVVVDRGWVPSEFDSPRDAGAIPPGGEVEVTGILLPSEGGGPLGNSKSGDSVARIHVEGLSQSLPYRTLPHYLALSTQDPDQAGEIPDPVTLAELGEGSHRIYAIQWFLFIVIGLVGYAAILRREARKKVTAHA